ncbi:hypothetical protein EJ05DRAFT_506102 [Pseudovirgaria hyperparasitica]|uniref:Uncharacterized protein n=1 Tax=Pseudovirgaria hyperparasitica TaxID=470096 RepID=A0A6A6VQH5_9PEZI|nr:uncharacterized protein EJ05DRAFT_506102 [Pseudovirgaria hyperparasitica]KAF2752375.1 hypothetical protein EJ05DRAFT_506102 [Pseudovirgaria hyperparasitica]
MGESKFSIRFLNISVTSYWHHGTNLSLVSIILIIAVSPLSDLRIRACGVASAYAAQVVALVPGVVLMSRRIWHQYRDPRGWEGELGFWFWIWTLLNAACDMASGGIGIVDVVSVAGIASVWTNEKVDAVFLGLQFLRSGLHFSLVLQKSFQNKAVEEPVLSSGQTISGSVSEKEQDHGSQRLHIILGTGWERASPGTEELLTVRALQSRDRELPNNFSQGIFPALPRCSATHSLRLHPASATSALQDVTPLIKKFLLCAQETTQFLEHTPTLLSEQTIAGWTERNFNINRSLFSPGTENGKARSNIWDADNVSLPPESERRLIDRPRIRNCGIAGSGPHGQRLGRSATNGQRVRSRLMKNANGMQTPRLVFGSDAKRG